MNKVNLKSILIAVLIILMIANIVALITFISVNRKMANPDCMYNYKGKHPRYFYHYELMKELKLDSNQIKKFSDLRKKYADDARTNFKEIKGIRDSIFNELIKDIPDTLILKSYNNRLIKFQEDMTMMTYYHIIEVKKVLNKEQQEKYFKFLNERIPGFHFPRHKKGGSSEKCPPPPFFE